MDQLAWNEVEIDSGEVWRHLLRWVEEVERGQSDIFDRFVKLAALYNPNRRGYDPDGTGSQAKVTKNVIASNCDSITGTIAARDIRTRCMTDGAEFSVQRRAKKMELYLEGLKKRLKVRPIRQRAFHASSLKGAGAAFVYEDPFDSVGIEHVHVDEIVVDEGEANGQEPMQMARRRLIPRARLRIKFPEYTEEIDRAQRGDRRSWRFWADYRPIKRDELVVIEAWFLPYGNEGSEGYIPGRHAIIIEGCDLEVEEYHERCFPIATLMWTPNPDGWYGIGGGERVIGHQRAINKTNWQRDRIRDQYAVPTTYAHISDAGMAVQTVSRLGTMAYYKTREPKTVFPPATSPELDRYEAETTENAFREFGQSQMAATATKPPGLDSGVALREYKDQTTDRFATQEKALEEFAMKIDYLILAACKRIAARGGTPPRVLVERWGQKAIDWEDVDMGDVEIQLEPASDLSRTSAGRLQLVMEFGQAGIISQDEVRRLIDHPDLERALSLYTAALEYVEYCLEQILDGEYVVPDGKMNLKMCVWRGMAQYQLAVQAGAPENVLDGLDMFVTLAAHLISESERQVQAAAAPMPMAPGMDPMALGPGAAPPLQLGPGAPPMGPGAGMPTMMDPSMAGAGVTPLPLAG